jgi:hypothetical protein
MFQRYNTHDVNLDEVSSSDESDGSVPPKFSLRTKGGRPAPAPVAQNNQHYLAPVQDVPAFGPVRTVPALQTVPAIPNVVLPPAAPINRPVPNLNLNEHQPQQLDQQNMLRRSPRSNKGQPPNRYVAQF